MNKKPAILFQVRRVFMFNAGIRLLVGLAILLFWLFYPNWPYRILIFTVGLLALGVATAYLILGWGLLNLSRWAYKPGIWLVENDGLCKFFGLPEKIKQPQVRSAFGLDNKEDK